MMAPARQSNVRCLTRCYCTAMALNANSAHFGHRCESCSKADQLGRLGSKPNTHCAHCRLGGSDVHLFSPGPSSPLPC